MIAIGSIAAAAFAQTTTSTTTTRTSAFPPVGIGSTETLQINILNAARASSTGTAASCTGTVSFSNASGTAIGTASSFTIAGGGVFSTSLPFSKAGIAGTRGEIVASISFTLTSGTPCAPVSSLETFDTSSGVTPVYLANGPGGYGGGPGFGPGQGGR